MHYNLFEKFSFIQMSVVELNKSDNNKKICRVLSTYKRNVERVIRYLFIENKRAQFLIKINWINHCSNDLLYKIENFQCCSTREGKKTDLNFWLIESAR